MDIGFQMMRYYNLEDNTGMDHLKNILELNVKNILKVGV